MQWIGKYVDSAGVSYPPLSSYSQHTTDWIFDPNNAALRSKYKKTFEYISRQLDVADSAEEESVAIDHIVASVISETRLASGIVTTTGLTARGFVDKILSKLPSPEGSQLAGSKRRRSSATGGHPADRIDNAGSAMAGVVAAPALAGNADVGNDALVTAVVGV